MPLPKVRRSDYKKPLIPFQAGGVGREGLWFQKISVAAMPQSRKGLEPEERGEAYTAVPTPKVVAESKRKREWGKGRDGNMPSRGNDQCGWESMGVWRHEVGGIRTFCPQSSRVWGEAGQRTLLGGLRRKNKGLDRKQSGNFRFREGWRRRGGPVPTMHTGTGPSPASHTYPAMAGAFWKCVRLKEMS